jgi:hypothetical protein
MPANTEENGRGRRAMSDEQVDTIQNSWSGMEESPLSILGLPPMNVQDAQIESILPSPMRITRSYPKKQSTTEVMWKRREMC